MTNVPKSSEVKWIHRSAELAWMKKTNWQKVQNIFILEDASSVQLAILKKQNPPGWTCSKVITTNTISCHRELYHVLNNILMLSSFWSPVTLRHIVLGQCMSIVSSEAPWGEKYHNSQDLRCYWPEREILIFLWILQTLSQVNVLIILLVLS